MDRLRKPVLTEEDRAFLAAAAKDADIVISTAAIPEIGRAHV